MKKLPILTLALLIIWTVSSCKSQEKNSEVMKKVDKLEQNDSKKLYFVARVAREKDTENLEVLETENDIIENSGNPLPLPSAEDATETFRCQILDQSGKVLFSSDQKTNFIYGDDKDEVIIKFIVPLPAGAQRATISYMRAEGVWEQLVMKEIK